MAKKSKEVELETPPAELQEEVKEVVVTKELTSQEEAVTSLKVYHKELEGMFHSLFRSSNDVKTRQLLKQLQKDLGKLVS